VRADAPQGQYSGPEGTLLNKPDKYVIDNWTHLIWQREPLASPGSFSFADDYCRTLEIAGVTGWRLPTIKELLTLVDERPRRVTDDWQITEDKLTDYNAFPRSPTGEYWTSSRQVGMDRVWTIDFADGQTSSGPIYETRPSRYTRCVRLAE
jgi:hypothetical protein